MGSGSSSVKSKNRQNSINGPDFKTDSLINGGSNLSAFDSSYRRRRTDEESNVRAPEADYEDGSLGISVNVSSILAGSHDFACADPESFIRGGPTLESRQFFEDSSPTELKTVHRQNFRQFIDKFYIVFIWNVTIFTIFLCYNERRPYIS